MRACEDWRAVETPSGTSNGRRRGGRVVALVATTAVGAAGRRRRTAGRRSSTAARWRAGRAPRSCGIEDGALVLRVASRRTRCAPSGRTATSCCASERCVEPVSRRRCSSGRGSRVTERGATGSRRAPWSLRGAAGNVARPARGASWCAARQRSARPYPRHRGMGRPRDLRERRAGPIVREWPPHLGSHRRSRRSASARASVCLRGRRRAIATASALPRHRDPRTDAAA